MPAWQVPIHTGLSIAFESTVMRQAIRNGAILNSDSALANSSFGRRVGIMVSYFC
jgi:hypothetical protein